MTCHSSLPFVLNLATQVLQDHRIEQSGKSRLQFVEDSIFVQWVIPVSTEKASSLTDEVLLKLIDANLDSKDVSFSFLPAKETTDGTA